MDDTLTLKADNETRVFVFTGSQYAVTEGCAQDFHLPHFQARMWKDTLYEHRFYGTVLIHGEPTRVHINAHSCTGIPFMITGISTLSLAHILTRTLVFTQVVPHLPQPCSLRREFCGPCSLKSQQCQGWKLAQLQMQQHTRAIETHVTSYTCMLMLTNAEQRGSFKIL